MSFPQTPHTLSQTRCRFLLNACRWMCVVVALVCSFYAHAQEEGVIVLSDTVTGNQEQPKVLYIVPWQAAHDNTMLKKALVTKLQNDVFAHIERPEHQRQLQLLTELTQTDDPSEEE